MFQGGFVLSGRLKHNFELPTKVGIYAIGFGTKTGPEQL